MENIIEKYEHKGREIEIYYAEDTESPREWDNLGHLFTFNNRYDIGDKHDYNSNMFNSFEEWKTQLKKDYKVLEILPVYMYDHSGQTIATTPFHCKWDSGQIGWIFTTPEKLKELGAPRETARQQLEDEIKTYDQYIKGEIYGFIVYKVETCNLGHKHRENVDSCSGYYSIEEAKTEAEAAI